MVAPLQRSRLGRGLASLIGDSTPGQSRLPPEGEQRTLAIEQIKASGLNPRRAFREEDLAELTESIRTKGIVQPILVRPDPNGMGYEIVAGERRWRAAQRSGLHVIPAIVRDLADQEVLELAIIENVQRADLNPIEEAAGYRDLIERYGYTQERLGEVIGKSRSHLANTLRLLKLPSNVQSMLQDGRLTAGHARALIGRDVAEGLAQHIIDTGMSVREAEALVQMPPATELGAGPRPQREKDPDTRAFEKELSDALGLKVEIKRSSGESGTMTIRYGNFDQLDYLRARLIGVGGQPANDPRHAARLNVAFARRSGSNVERRQQVNLASRPLLARSDGATARWIGSPLGSGHGEYLLATLVDGLDEGSARRC
jgi:ParB family chromosome partitioning protein